MKSEEFMKVIEKGDIGPLYFLHGDETYLMDRSVKLLLERLVDPGFRDFNLNVFYGNECKGDEIFSTVQTLPMFAERRVVLVKRGHELSASAAETLIPYLQDPSKSSCLIFQGDKIDLRKKFFVEFKKSGELVEFKRPFDNQLGPFIRNEAKYCGKQIEPAAVELLAFLVGNNLQEMASQIEKVATYIGTKDTIRIADVRGVVSDTRVDTVFEFADAIGEKQMDKAMRTLNTLLRDGEAPLLVLAIMARHFRQLWRVRELLDRKAPSSEISKSAGINPYFLKKVIAQAGFFKCQELKVLFERLFDMDLALKSGCGKPAVLLEQLVMDICASK